ncbi:hypothetical protein B4U37_05255 [Sutcliffiella horikoshii]|uniref:Uncharacterized protein n=1 Tax=Sutcliffiella horikoshii TaxID=79883 RepID=A0ABM6KQ18_9BACI|nr:hypothetical protein B4U37_05255 [Sutcliffiella horikoshii]
MCTRCLVYLCIR